MTPSVVHTHVPTQKPTRVGTATPSTNPALAPTVNTGDDSASSMESTTALVIGATAGGATCLVLLCFVLYQRVRYNGRKSKKMFQVTSIAALTSTPSLYMYGGYGAGWDGVLRIGEQMSSKSDSASIDSDGSSHELGSESESSELLRSSISSEQSNSVSSGSSRKFGSDGDVETESGYSELLREWETDDVDM